LKLRSIFELNTQIYGINDSCLEIFYSHTKICKELQTLIPKELSESMTKAVRDLELANDMLRVTWENVKEDLYERELGEKTDD